MDADSRHVKKSVSAPGDLVQLLPGHTQMSCITGMHFVLNVCEYSSESNVALLDTSGHIRWAHRGQLARDCSKGYVTVLASHSEGT